MERFEDLFDAYADGELTPEQLETVTGGLLNAAIAGAIAGGAMGVGPHDDGVLPTLPCDPVDILCRIFLGFAYVHSLLAFRTLRRP